MENIEKRNLIVSIFKAEAKNGNSELSPDDIVDHSANHKPKGGSLLSRAMRMAFPLYISDSAQAAKLLEDMATDEVLDKVVHRLKLDGEYAADKVGRTKYSTIRYKPGPAFL